jgi:hypothetical protein
VKPTSRSQRIRFAALAIAALALPGSVCRIVLEGDPLLSLDVFDGQTWNAAEIVPNAPWIRPGRDRELGTADDEIKPSVRGDIDLVLRSGGAAIGATIPAPTASAAPSLWPQGVAEPFAEGTPIDFVVIPVDGHTSSLYGTPGAPPYWNGMPVLVLAFADLDGDGFIGVTNLDGDAFDHALEEAEWSPVGRRFTFGAAGQATGSLQIGVGGPSAAPARVVLGAAAWAGKLDPAFLGGNVPRGPAVMTRLPFLPVLDPTKVLEGGPTGPPPPTPTSLVGVEIRVAYAPNPNDPRVGESFTLRLDGSDPTIDAARVQAGVSSRFGVVQQPDPATYLDLPARPLRPGLAPGGARAAVEVLTRALVADDGAATRTAMRVVPLDRLGNVTDPAATTPVTLRTSGPVRIAFPDTDGDPHLEIVSVVDAIGAAVELDDSGGALDDVDADALLIEAGNALARVELLLPDPDVDDSGTVTSADVDAIDAHRGDRLGDASFESRFDLNANGRIDDDDAAIAEAQLGALVAIP